MLSVFDRPPGDFDSVEHGELGTSLCPPLPMLVLSSQSRAVDSSNLTRGTREEVDDETDSFRRAGRECTGVFFRDVRSAFNMATDKETVAYFLILGVVGFGQEQKVSAVPFVNVKARIYFFVVLGNFAVSLYRQDRRH
jgi:hypothetical protein